MSTAAAAPPGGPGALVATDRYPITDPARRARVVESARSGLEADGVAVLPGFLAPQALARAVAEADELAPRGHHSVVHNSPYLGLPDPDVPPGDPRGAEVRSSLRAVASDLIGDDTVLRQLYTWEPLVAFVADVLGVERLHPYADPLGALNVAVMVAGDELGWHFDQSDFVTSIALRSPVVGGAFEVAARLRSPDDEHLDDVAAVLAGDRGRVTHVPFDPGALMIFAGRHSLHRVTPIGGDVSRLVALLAYDTRPGTDSSELLKLVRYGRLPGTPAPAAPA